MLFARAEREGDWPLHLFATEQMVPYFLSQHVDEEADVTILQQADYLAN